MGKGKRYNGEKKLNMKKVFTVIIAVIVLIMFVIIIKKLLTNDNSSGKIQKTSYYTVYSDSKWGVIDSSGKKIIEPSYAEMILIPNNKEPLFICTYDVDYTNSTYKTKVLNQKNEEILKDYELVEVLDNYDNNKNIWYEDALKVKKNNKYGLVNFAGKEILECNYDNIYAVKGIKNSIIVEKDGKKGLVSNDGNQIIPAEYKEIKPLGNEYKTGYIVENEEGKFGIINYNKETVLECEYDDIKNNQSIQNFIVKQNEKWKVINKDKQDLLNNEFEDIKSVDNEYAVVQKNKKYGIYTINGEEKVDAIYNDIEHAFGENFIAKKDKNYGIINLNNDTILNFEYTDLEYNSKANFMLASKDEINTQILDSNFEVKLTGILSELNLEKGYMKLRVDNEYKYYNFKFEEKSNKEILETNTLFLDKKDGKYGYVDKTGKVIVEHIYDDAREQNEYGYSAIKKDGKWGAIDRTGKVVLEPKYDLENYLMIDFIAEWHLGKDINSNYYTDEE